MRKTMTEEACLIDITVELMRHSLACLNYNNRKGEPREVIKKIPGLIERAQ